MKNASVAWVLGLALALGVGQVTAQIVWTKDARNPVLSGGESGAWNRHVFSSSVLYNPDSSRYETWFDASGGSSTLPWFPYRVGFATSPDGVTWRKHPLPVLTPDWGAWDQLTVENPKVIRENGFYKMWYSGCPTNDFKYSIGYATSPDGINWTKYPGNPVMGSGTAAWDAGGAYTGSIMPSSGGYKMWYAGWGVGDPGADVGLAVSPDGIAWQRDTLHNPVLTRGVSGEWDFPLVVVSQVLQIDNLNCMWYLGARPGSNVRNIGFATSTDGGTTWSKFPGNPVMSPTPGMWDGSYVNSGPVLLHGDTLHMWYTGSVENTLVNLWRIGHATSLLCSYAEKGAASPAYVRPALDTVCITGSITRLRAHPHHLSAIVSDDAGVVQDSVTMFDDGHHGDAEASDDMWGCMVKAPSEEGMYSVCLRTEDLTSGLSQRVEHAVRFTTAGPVACVGDTTNITPAWGQTVMFRFRVGNVGATKPLPSVKGEIRSLDSAAKILSGVYFTVGDLLPGQVRLSSTIRVQFSSGEHDPRAVPFEFVFSSGGTNYWRDTAQALVTGVGLEGGPAIPAVFVLRQNYPNPFNPSTTIRYGLPSRSHVRLTVFNTLGQQVATVVEGEMEAGYHEAVFDASGLASGVYLYRLTAGSYVETRRLVLVR